MDRMGSSPCHCRPICPFALGHPDPVPPLSPVVDRRPSKVVLWPLEDICLDRMSNYRNFCAEFGALNIDEHVGQCQEKRKTMNPFMAGRLDRIHSNRTFAAHFFTYILHLNSGKLLPHPGKVGERPLEGDLYLMDEFPTFSLSLTNFVASLSNLWSLPLHFLLSASILRACLASVCCFPPPRSLCSCRSNSC
jgi:hypothetical protein